MNKKIPFVLLIDDDQATNFFNLMMVSKHTDFENVSAVRSGFEAIEYITAIPHRNIQKPDLIFLDINMPGMNGWDFLRVYSKLPKELTFGIKVIILSTTSNPVEINKSRKEFEVDDFISKPLSIPLLNEVYETHFVDHTINSPNHPHDLNKSKK